MLHLSLVLMSQECQGVFPRPRAPDNMSCLWLLRDGLLPFSPCISKAPSNFSPILCPPPQTAPLKKHCTEGLLPSDKGDVVWATTSPRHPPPWSQGGGGRAGGPWCQLEGVVRGTPGPRGPLDCLCSLERLTPRKEEANPSPLPGPGVLYLRL